MDPNLTPSATPPAPSEAPSGTEAVRDQDKMMLFLAYFGIFALIPFSVVKDSDYVHWHSKQGLTYTVACVALGIAWAVVNVILGFLHLGFLGLLGSLALIFATFVVWLLAVIKAMGGERWRIPVVADLSERW